jgi:HAD superfamily hydrolase (TIGR01509 family)
LTSPETAADLVAAADAVLLDFDGPICAVFAAYRAHEVSEEIMRRVADAGIRLRPSDPNDPISVLRATAGTDAQIIAVVQDALVTEEAKALGRTEPHPGIPELVVELRKSGHRLAIVTNNGAGPVSDFIEHHGLADHIETVIGRDPVHPELLKPSPHSLKMALAQLDLRPSAAIFIGDSISDVQAGHAADLRVIGLANKPGKHQRLRDAGADAIITVMGDLVRTPRPAP